MAKPKAENKKRVRAEITMIHEEPASVIEISGCSNQIEELTLLTLLRDRIEERLDEIEAKQFESEAA